MFYLSAWRGGVMSSAPLVEVRDCRWNRSVIATEMSTNVENLPFSVVCPLSQVFKFGQWCLVGRFKFVIFYEECTHFFLHTCDTLNTENITCLLTVKVKKQLLDIWINQLTPLLPWIYEIPKDIEVRITKEEGKEMIVPCKSCSVASNPTDPVIGHGI